MADTRDSADNEPVIVLPLPRVVVVLVTNDPGGWFRQTLESLAAQDYPNLGVVLLDQGHPESFVGLRAQVRAVLPEAAVFYLTGVKGFGPAANEVLPGGVAHNAGADADLFLFCRDDVELVPGTVRALVHTAATTGAGIVGPKLVDRGDPRRLAQMGMAVRWSAETVPLVEPGEIDQGQHDGTREVFAVGGAVLLVRARLFCREGGFDEDITWLGDDLSLCWRARLAGRPVVVTSATRVGCGAGAGERLPVARQETLIRRHRLRVLLTCVGWRRRLRLLPVLAVTSLMRILAALLTGRFRVAGAEAASWPWNLAHYRSVWIARRQVKRFRQVSDRGLRRWQAPRVMRPRWLRRPDTVGAGLPKPVPGAAWRSLWTTGSALVVAGLVMALVLGSRHLITRGVPQVGQFVWLDSPGTLLAEWRTGWRRTGLGSEAPIPALYPVVAALGGLVWGHMALLRTIITLGMLPVGVLGAFRAVRRGGPGRMPGLGGSPRAATAAAVAYAVVPLPYLALQTGRWDSLVAYAAAPWLLSGLLRAGPLRDGVLGVGVVVGLTALMVPSAPVLVILAAVAVAMGALLAFDVRAALRPLIVGVGAVLVAAVLHLPWSLAVAGPAGSAATWLGLTEVGGGDLGSGATVSGLGADPRLWALLGAAALPLLVGRAERLGWALRAWAVILSAGAAAWVQEGGVPAWAGVRLPLPRPDILLALAAAGVAVAVGCGVAAAEADVAGRSRRFGLRRLAVALACCALLYGAVPAVARTLDGRWDMPKRDFSRLLAGVSADLEAVPSRVLWVGRHDTMPGDGWATDDGTVYATSFTALPTVTGLHPGAETDVDRMLVEILDLARTGGTTRAGELLAPMAVQYVVLPLQPAPGDAEGTQPAQSLLDGLAGQLDLQRVTLDSSLVVYRNLAFLPEYAEVSVPGVGEIGRPGSPRGDWPTGGSPELVAQTGSGDEVRPALTVGGNADVTRAGGHLGQDTVLLHAVAADSGDWVLYVDGVRVERRTAFGWANAFVVAAAGRAELRYEPSWRHQGLLVAQVGAWLGVAVLAVRGRNRREQAGKPAGKAVHQVNRRDGRPDPALEYVKVVPTESADSGENGGVTARAGDAEDAEEAEVVGTPTPADDSEQDDMVVLGRVGPAAAVPSAAGRS